MQKNCYTFVGERQDVWIGQIRFVQKSPPAMVPDFVGKIEARTFGARVMNFITLFLLCKNIVVPLSAERQG